VSSQLGIPSSYSHALIGGLVGAAVAGYGIEALQARGLLRIVLILFTSPLLGLIVGYGMQKLIFFLCRGATPRINTFFRKSQGFTATALALSHGANDAQKTVGLITVGLLAQGALPAFRSPPWVVMACAATIALGTAVGGWSVIRTLGRKFYKVRPVHSFTSHLASAAIVFGAGALGGPVSTSQIVSTTILGVGAAERMNMVRWGVMKQIMVTWLITMPAVAVMAALFYWLLV
jgi:PiT family inorganic phosphate transporter